MKNVSNYTEEYRKGTRRIIWRAIAVTIVLMVVIVYFWNPFASTSDFEGRSGLAAKLTLHDWPPGVRAGDVTSVSYKAGGSIDSHTQWYKIQLNSAAADKWMNHVHRDVEQSAPRWLAYANGEDFVEGVDRTMDEFPNPRHPTGAVPNWWGPPALKTRATEMMKWYGSMDSGVGIGVYSIFDEKTSTLWICDYSAQHDQLWKRGNVPEGKQFLVKSKNVGVQVSGPIPKP